MASRRPHKKSRLGCVTCKQRRVKCDERGPPCGPCAARSIGCEYPTTHQPKLNSPSTANAKIDARAALVNTEWSSSRRKLELRLMLQWTTSTYKSYCGTVEDEYYNWQVTVSELALKHDFLLHGLFAMSALEIGAFSETGTVQEYIDLALQEQNLASSMLREELAVSDLSVVAQEKHQALWALSSILMVLALALPPYTIQSDEKYNMLDHMMVYLELLKGLVIIMASKLKSYKDDPLLCKYREWHELPLRPIEVEVQRAIDRLKDLNEDTHGAARSERKLSELKAMSYHAGCRRALFFLEECCAKCSEPDTRAYGLAWLLQSGQDYISALKDREPVALLILMHWGVFMEQQSYGVWYVKQVGKYLVQDLSDVAYAFDDERLRIGVEWAREQVGLQKLS